MARAINGAVVEQIRRLFGPDGTVSGLDEVQIFQRYVARRDDVAFEALVRRHGPMVLHVCRQLLREPQDVEDAFQATFLVLVRKAGSIRRPERLANWLYGVAYRVAQRSKVDAARRRRHEEQASARSEAVKVSTPNDPDLAPVLQEELHRLPEKYRLPIVLCYLEGRTQEEAAKLLKWPVGTVKGRLSRARGILQRRLDRRGLSIPITTLTALLSRDVAASVLSPVLLNSTVKAAAVFAVGGTALAGAGTGLVPSSTFSLAEGAIQAMFFTKLKAVATLLVAGSVAATGAGVYAIQDQGTAEASAPEIDEPKAQDPKAGGISTENPFEPETSTNDPFGLPGGTAGADAGLVPPRSQPADGSDEASMEQGRLPVRPGFSTPAQPTERDAKIRAALREPIEPMDDPKPTFEDYLLHLQNSTIGEDLPQGIPIYVNPEGLQFAGQTLQSPVPTAEDVEPAGMGLKRVLDELGLDYWVNQGLLAIDAKVSVEDFFRERLSLVVNELADVKRDRPGTLDGLASGGGGVDASEGYQPGGQDPRSRAIVTKLAQPISFPFRQETPLSDVLEYIKQATADKERVVGLPIYVDPLALRELDLTMDSPVTIELEGVPLRTTLRLMLRQLGLVYSVIDGVLIISTPEALDELLAFGPIYEMEQAQAQQLLGGSPSSKGEMGMESMGGMEMEMDFGMGMGMEGEMDMGGMPGKRGGGF